MKFEANKIDESLFAATDIASGERFVSSWNLNSKRDYPKMEVDSCGCTCGAKP